MKNSLVFSLILVFITSFQLKAQEQTLEARTKKGFISIGIGPTFATGDFANSDSGSETAGLASVGAQANFFNFGYLLSENFGFSARVAGALHTIDEDALGITIDNTPTWKYLTFMVGPIISLPSANESISFDIRALIGLMNANSPKLEGGGFTRESLSGSGLATNFGISLRNHVTENSAVFFSLDYLSAEPEFEDDAFKQSISSISFSIGGSWKVN